MASDDESRLPGLFRTGDLGVSAEWRDVSYDWSPVLTMHGVSVYSYLRDTYDADRNRYQFLLHLEGPTKQRIQKLLGLKTAYALDGPEYLLATVGLLHVELRRGTVNDPDRRNTTNVAYYTVGRLDHPVLDWTMLDRILDALVVAFDASSPQHAGVKKAEAAIRSLGQAGMLQNCDPAHYYYPSGAWPNLLATLIHDERWVQLFSHLHGADAITVYRQQARAWIQACQRRTARLSAENDRIRGLLLKEQRQPTRPTRSASDISSSSSDTPQNNLESPATDNESLATH